jgi:pyruvate formate lyase activating enzyme
MLHRNSSGVPCALVSSIQKYTIHDGPGIRTEIFFTGCTMRCLWCSNPETIAPKAQIGVYPDKCVSLEKCGACVKVCPQGGQPLGFKDGVIQADGMLDACTGCFRCTDTCPSRALKRWGELMTVEELMKVILEDRNLYRKSGGGVTLSGGEVLLQWEFAALLLEACKKAGINTCVETALNCPSEHMEAVYPFADLVITDIKHMDTTKHRACTGAGNELVLNNIRRTADLGKPLVIRTPVVPGYNNDEANIRATGAFIRDQLDGKIVQYQLLPYRKLGLEKYEALGMPYPMGEYDPPERSIRERELLRYADMLVSEYGIPAVAGTGKKLEL